MDRSGWVIEVAVRRQAVDAPAWCQPAQASPNTYREATPAAGAADEPVCVRQGREERLAGGRERRGADQG